MKQLHIFWTKRIQVRTTTSFQIAVLGFQSSLEGIVLEICKIWWQWQFFYHLKSPLTGEGMTCKWKILYAPMDLLIVPRAKLSF